MWTTLTPTAPNARLKGRKDKLAAVSLSTPLFLFGEEWVRVIAGPTSFKLERGLLGSKASTHPAGTKMVPHVMLPDGSTGVTGADMLGVV